MPIVRYEKQPGAGHIRTEDYSEGTGRMNATSGPLRYARAVDELRAKFEHLANVIDMEDDEVLKTFSGKELADFLPSVKAVAKARMPGAESARQTVKRVQRERKKAGQETFNDTEGDALATALEKRGL